MTDRPPRSALSAVVKQLVSSSRQPALSVANPDEETLDLERQAAELIMQEAAEYRRRYEREGVSAYLHAEP